jgi:ribosomal protein S5
MSNSKIQECRVSKTKFELRSFGKLIKVTKVTKGGRAFGFAIVVSDENGVVGSSHQGKSKDVPSTVKAVEDAKKNLS